MTTAQEMAAMIVDGFEAVDSYGVMTPVGEPPALSADAKLAALVEMLDGDPELSLLDALKEIDVKRNPHLYSEPQDKPRIGEPVIPHDHKLLALGL